MNIRNFGAVLILLFSATLVQAHPVTYKDGVGLMAFNSPTSNELMLTYSMSPRWALAMTYLREQKSEFYLPRLNLLLKRWNQEDSQANIYLSLSPGVEKFNSQNYQTNFAEFIADWESRKYMVSLEHQYFARENETNLALANKDFNKSKLRFGFAPYLVEANDLSAWYVAEFNRTNDNPQIEAVQFLRFYKKNILWEVGAGFDGSLAFNFMIHM
jgi:hypothetical protein